MHPLVPYLLGTQRDINRLINRGMDFIIKPLNVFNDLYQYVSVCSNIEEKRFYAEKFVNLLLSDDVQNSLTEIGMLSPFMKLKYDNKLSELQNEGKYLTISPFTSKSGVDEIKTHTEEYLKGDKEALIKIKNIII